MKSDNKPKDWKSIVEQLDQQFDEDAFIQNLKDEDPDLVDLIKANRIMDNLDDIGLQKAPSDLNKKLYALTEQKKSTKPLLFKWGAMASAAAILAVAVLINPWQQQHPNNDEIEQARNQLAMTFFYLNKAANKTRAETQKTIAETVYTAMNSSQFLAPDEEPVNL